MRTPPIRVLFLTRSWDRGGAERQLLELLRSLDNRRVSATVASFYGGPLQPPAGEGGDVRFVTLEKRSRWHLAPVMIRLWRLIREVRPQIIHGYQGVPNLLAIPSAWAAGARVVWGIRASNVELARYDWLFRLEHSLQRLTARLPDLIIVNSEAGRRFQLTQGFPPGRMVVIPNGIDTDRFKPDPQARELTRSRLGIPATVPLIGLVGRLDPMKDHPTFLRAAAQLRSRRETVRFLCAGDGPAGYADELRQLASELGLEDRLLWIRGTDGIESIYNALDVLVLSSAYGEGFPNVLAEAMACGIRCASTDVGDAAHIIGDTGFVVPPGDAPALADACWRLLEEPPPGSPRQRIVANFGRDVLAQRTADALVHLAESAAS